MFLSNSNHLCVSGCIVNDDCSSAADWKSLLNVFTF